MIPISAVSGYERKSECPTCPPWVRRCAHFPDGKVMRLHNHPSNGLIFVCLEGDVSTPEGWRWCGKDIAIEENDVAANAAFHEAEQRLLEANE